MVYLQLKVVSVAVERLVLLLDLGLDFFGVLVEILYKLKAGFRIERAGVLEEAGVDEHFVELLEQIEEHASLAVPPMRNEGLHVDVALLVNQGVKQRREQPDPGNGLGESFWKGEDELDFSRRIDAIGNSD